MYYPFPVSPATLFPPQPTWASTSRPDHPSGEKTSSHFWGPGIPWQIAPSLRSPTTTLEWEPLSGPLWQSTVHCLSKKQLCVNSDTRLELFITCFSSKEIRNSGHSILIFLPFKTTPLYFYTYRG